MYVYERLIMKHVDKIAQKKNPKLIFFHRHTKITIIYEAAIDKKKKSELSRKDLLQRKL